VFTYETTAAFGCFAFSSFKLSIVIMFAIGQVASLAGSKTFEFGFRILAVSAIKSTPQNTIILASVLAAFLARSNESPKKSATS